MCQLGFLKRSLPIVNLKMHLTSRRRHLPLLCLSLRSVHSSHPSIIISTYTSKPLVSCYRIFFQTDFLLLTILAVARSNQQGMLLTCSMYCNIASVSQDLLSITNIIQNSYLQTSEVMTLNPLDNELAEKHLLCIYMDISCGSVCIPTIICMYLFNRASVI